MENQQLKLKQENVKENKQFKAKITSVLNTCKYPFDSRLSYYILLRTYRCTKMNFIIKIYKDLNNSKMDN